MRKKFNIILGYFLLVFVFAGCENTNAISNSAGPSSPGNIYLNVDVVPPITNPGGSVVVTATALYANGVPASGLTVAAASDLTGLSAASGVTDSAGQVVFTYATTGSVPATLTLSIEDIFVQVRINVNPSS